MFIEKEFKLFFFSIIFFESFFFFLNLVFSFSMCFFVQNKKITNILILETIRALMNYVVRIDTRGKSTLAPGQTRPIDKEESIIRRSYNVGELFVNVSPEMETLIEEKLDDFSKCLKI